MTAVTYAELLELAGGRAVVDVACPWCGPERRTPLNRKRQVLRLWNTGEGFISYHCARCGEHGYLRQDEGREIDREVWKRQRQEIAKRDREAEAVRAEKAAYLWRQRRPLHGSIAEKYLREVRGISCPLPATLGSLPARGDYPPSLIAAFGPAWETEPGVVAIAAALVRSVHLTRLLPDGSGKAPEPSKIILGRSVGIPIVLAPPNDLLGLAITEGLEDALSVHEATGLGAWAAGAASRLPGLGEAVPAWIDCVSIYADANQAGTSNSRRLAEALTARGIYAELVHLAGVP